MKCLNCFVGVIFSECRRIESIIIRSTEIAEDIISHSLMLIPSSSICSKIVSTTRSSVGGLNFASEQVEVGL